MIPLCPECTKFGEPAKLTLKGKKLVCDTCGYVYPEEFIEKDGMLLSSGAIELTPRPNTTMYVKLVDNSDPSKASYACVESFPLLPFQNGKRVKEYKIAVRYELRTFYEKDNILGSSEENRPL